MRVINQLFITFTMQFETRWVGRLQRLVWLRLRHPLLSVLARFSGSQQFPKSSFSHIGVSANL